MILEPSRLHKGKFYALPPSTTDFQTIIDDMLTLISIFQIAPCFRDEDARADRSPREFLSIETFEEWHLLNKMTFFKLGEPVFIEIFSEISNNVR